MWLSFFLILFASLYFLGYRKHKRLMNLTSNIPGPPSYPFIGSPFLYKQKSVQDSMKLMEEFMDKYGKIVKLSLLNEIGFLVADPKILEALLSSPKYPTKNIIYGFLKSWLRQGLLISTGKKWFQRRKIITPTFHFKILEEFVEIFDEQCIIFIERLKEQCDKGAFDINPYVTLSALDIISETALGTKIHAQTNPDCEYARAVATMTDIVMTRSINVRLMTSSGFLIFGQSLRKKQNAAIKVLHSFTETIIEERRETLLNEMNNKIENRAEQEIGTKRKMALLDVLLQSTIDGKPLSNEDIREEVDTFTFEGHDTTTAAISFTLYLLSRHPGIQDKVFAEIREVIGDDLEKPVPMKDLNDLKYLDIVLKESMRLYPPVPFIGRRLDEDLRIGDIFLPIYSQVAIPIYKILKDPDVFPEPEKFIPERFLADTLSEKATAYSYIPFSAGPRNCIGQKFAMLELKSSVSKVLRNFELLPLGEEPKATVSIVTRSTNGVNLGIRQRVYA